MCSSTVHARACDTPCDPSVFNEMLELAQTSQQHEAMAYLHHCLSHGMPSLFPSIFVPGQFFRNNFASSHEVICEQ